MSKGFRARVFSRFVMVATLRLLFVSVLFGSGGLIYGEEQVRAVQEELRRRNMYFGDVDGRKSHELQEALKRYQKRKGFTATGDEDRDTLRSLGLLARSPDEPPPRELEWPEEPVLRSDAAINVPAEAEAIAEETGVDPVSVAPERLDKTSKPASGRQKSSQKRASKARLPQLPKTNSREDQQISTAELRRFVRDYLRAVSRNDLQEELRFYADRVKYYNNGEVDRRIVERFLSRYYERWTSRRFDLGEVIRYALVPSRGEIVVTFRVEFSLKGPIGKVRGVTDNTFVINAATADPRIVSIQERRVRGT